jgi:glyceraldehyde 3-phosphate dehydrogenase
MVILRSTADPENNALIINGTTVHIITANGPEEIDYTLFDIHNALVITPVHLLHTKR